MNGESDVYVFQNKGKPYKCPYCKEVFERRKDAKWYSCKYCHRDFNPKFVEDPEYIWYIPKEVFDLVMKNKDLINNE